MIKKVAIKHIIYVDVLKKMCDNSYISKFVSTKQYLVNI